MNGCKSCIGEPAPHSVVRARLSANELQAVHRQPARLQSAPTGMCRVCPEGNANPVDAVYNRV